MIYLINNLVIYIDLYKWFIFIIYIIYKYIKIIDLTLLLSIILTFGYYNSLFVILFRIFCK